MLETYGIWMYPAGIVVLSICFWLWLRHVLGHRESKRRRGIEDRQRLEAVPSRAPVRKLSARTREYVLRRIESRFSITKRVFFFCLIGVTGLVVAVPYLSRFTLPAMIVSILVAVITVVVGFAARPFVENMISGLVLTFGGLARIGDTVLVDDQYGTIEDVTLTHCIIRRWDWLRYVVSNSAMLSKEFTNYTLKDSLRWVWVEFWIDYASDLDRVQDIATKAPKNSPYYSDMEDPRFWIVDMTSQSVKCLVVAWATSPPDGWMLSNDIRDRLVRDFQQLGIQTHTYRLGVLASKDTPGTLPMQEGASAEQNGPLNVC